MAKRSTSLVPALLRVTAWKQESCGYPSIRTAGSSNKVQDVILKGVIKTSLFRGSVIPCDICAKITFPCHNIHWIWFNTFNAFHIRAAQSLRETILPGAAKVPLWGTRATGRMIPLIKFCSISLEKLNANNKNSGIW